MDNDIGVLMMILMVYSLCTDINGVLIMILVMGYWWLCIDDVGDGVGAKAYGDGVLSDSDDSKKIDRKSY